MYFYDKLHRIYDSKGLEKRIANHKDGLTNTGDVVIDVTVNKIYMSAKQHYETLKKEQVKPYPRNDSCKAAIRLLF